MVRHLHSRGRQFADVEELSEMIQEAWKSIGVTTMKHRYHSTLRNIVYVFKRIGGSMDYELYWVCKTFEFAFIFCFELWILLSLTSIMLARKCFRVCSVLK